MNQRLQEHLLLLMGLNTQLPGKVLVGLMLYTSEMTVAVGAPAAGSTDTRMRLVGLRLYTGEQHKTAVSHAGSAV
jgi:hypothetical protein